MSRTCAWLVVGVLGIVSPAGARPELAQFDLICEAVQEGAAAGHRVSSRLRVDLAAGLWCIDTCKGRGLKIRRVTDDRITLAEDLGPQSRTAIWVDRQTGAYHHEVLLQGAFSMAMRGHCETAPYTGQIGAPTSPAGTRKE